jgi:hypothetical protein
MTKSHSCWPIPNQRRDLPQHGPGNKSKPSNTRVLHHFGALPGRFVSLPLPDTFFNHQPITTNGNRKRHQQPIGSNRLVSVLSLSYWICYSIHLVCYERLQDPCQTTSMAAAPTVVSKTWVSAMPSYELVVVSNLNVDLSKDRYH